MFLRLFHPSFPFSLPSPYPLGPTSGDGGGCGHRRNAEAEQVLHSEIRRSPSRRRRKAEWPGERSLCLVTSGLINACDASRLTGVPVPQVHEDDRLVAVDGVVVRGMTPQEVRAPVVRRTFPSCVSSSSSLNLLVDLGVLCILFLSFAGGSAYSRACGISD